MNKFLIHLSKEIKLHLFDYILLISFGIFFLIAVNLFKGERTIEFLLLISFVSFYIIWGVYHHVLKHTLHLKVLLEYILIGFTVAFLMKIIIFP